MDKSQPQTSGPTLPPWMGAPSTPQPRQSQGQPAVPPPAQQSTVQQTTEPVVERAGVTSSSSKGPNKILNYGGAIFSVLLLSSLTYFSLKFLSKGAFRGISSSPEPQAITQDLRSTGEKNLKVGPGEKGSVANWKQPAQLLSLPFQEQKTAIAKEVLAWLDEQRDSRGVYILGYQCILGDDCGQQETDNRAGLSAIWGRFKYYQQLADPNDLTIIGNDLSLYANKDMVSVIQNNFWNCKLMYEMWQSDVFSSAQKDKIKQICDKSSYYPPDLQEIDKQIELGQTGIGNFKQLLNNKSEASLAPTKRSSQGVKLIEYSAYASDFVAKYLWQKEETDLIRAQIYFNKGVDLLVQETTSSYLEGKCVLGTAALDIYQATNNSAYLDFSQLLLEKEKIQDVCLSSQGEVGYCSSSMFEQATCGLFIDQLADLSGEAKYKTLKDSFITYTNTNLFNLPEYSGGGEGKGAFYSKIKLSTEETFIYKSVRENGLFTGLLMME